MEANFSIFWVWWCCITWKYIFFLRSVFLNIGENYTSANNYWSAKNRPG